MGERRQPAMGVVQTSAQDEMFAEARWTKKGW